MVPRTGVIVTAFGWGENYGPPKTTDASPSIERWGDNFKSWLFRAGTTFFSFFLLWHLVALYSHPHSEKPRTYKEIGSGAENVIYGDTRGSFYRLLVQHLFGNFFHFGKGGLSGSLSTLMCVRPLFKVCVVAGNKLKINSFLLHGWFMATVSFERHCYAQRHQFGRMGTKKWRYVLWHDCVLTSDNLWVTLQRFP